MTDFGLMARIGRTRSSYETTTSQGVERFCAVLSKYLAPIDSRFAPLGYHWCIGPEAATADELSHDGSVLGVVGAPPSELPHRVWAGGRVRFHAEIPIGTRVERIERVEAIEIKDGRVGPIGLITINCQFRTNEGLAITEWRTLAFFNRTSQPLRASEPTRPTDKSVDVVATWSFNPDPVLLFRYSALTFNSHRIHFDRSYCSSAEGINGLVVQGPLQATVLLNACAKVNGEQLRHFEYRNHRILTDQPGARIDVHRRQGNRLSTAVYDKYGEKTTTATAY